LDLARLFERDSYAREYPAGARIFAAGEHGDEMYVVLEGEVSIMAQGKVLETVARGGIFGEMALVDDSPRSADAVAGSDCRVAAIDRRHFTYLVQETPFFALQVMSIMADRLRRRTSAA
jgi:CRP-like cAMP-binding protein